MNSQLHFSVVIPLYNKRDYIQKTIDSVLHQTYPHFEVIVVDDGSTDGSAELIENITDSRVRLIKQENAGVSVARNRGIQDARFEYIALLDADDWWDEDFLKSITGLIDHYPEVLLFCTKYARVKNGEMLPQRPFFKSDQPEFTFDLIEVLLANNDTPINSSNAVFKKSLLLLSGGYDPRIRYCEDVDLFLRMSAFSRIAYYCERPVSFYCKDGPAEHRASGRLPPLNAHMLGHLEKFEAFYEHNERLLEYLDWFKLTYLSVYIEKRVDMERVKEISSGVDMRKCSMIQRIYFSFTPASRIFVRIVVVLRIIKNMLKAPVKRMLYKMKVIKT